MGQKTKTIINVLLVIAVVLLSYLTYETIMRPVRFEKEYKKRSQIVIEKLKKIREVELAYYSKYQKYCGSWDTLINFIKNENLLIIKSEGIVPDSLYDISKTKEEAEKKALKLGIIKRDTIYVSVKDSLFKNYNVDTLPYIPYTNIKEKFQLQAGFLKTVTKAVRPVFEVKAHNNSFCQDMDKQLLINLNDKLRKMERFPGWVLGSMNEVTTTGNWD